MALSVCIFDDWLFGYWTDELEDWRVETTCEWGAHRNFLTRTFKVTKKDQTQIQGAQVIGYDPVADRFRCWVFHSGGGFGEGAIQFTNDRYVVASPDGSSYQSELAHYPIHRSKDGKWTVDTIGQVTLPVAQAAEEMSIDNIFQVEDVNHETLDSRRLGQCRSLGGPRDRDFRARPSWRWWKPRRRWDEPRRRWHGSRRRWHEPRWKQPQFTHYDQL